MECKQILKLPKEKFLVKLRLKLFIFAASHGFPCSIPTGFRLIGWVFITIPEWWLAMFLRQRIKRSVAICPSPWQLAHSPLHLGYVSGLEYEITPFFLRSVPLQNYWDDIQQETSSHLAVTVSNRSKNGRKLLQTNGYTREEAPAFLALLINLHLTLQTAGTVSVHTFWASQGGRITLLAGCSWQNHSGKIKRL